MAKKADGGYWPAERIQDLDGEVRAAALKAPDEFLVLDSTGKEITRGKFGESKTLPAGSYTLRTRFGPKTYDQPFQISKGQEMEITFDPTRISGK